MITLVVSFAILALIVLTGFVYNHCGGWAAILLLFSGVTYHYMVDRTAFPELGDFISKNPGLSFTLLSCYVLIGLVWSFVKWVLHVKRMKAKGKLKDSSYVDASQHIDRIVTWMAYWPISLIITLFSDIIAEFYRWLYTKVSGVYTKITNSIYGE